MTRVLRLGNAGTAVPKERCDNAYHFFMEYTEIAFRDYNPGDIFLKTSFNQGGEGL